MQNTVTAWTLEDLLLAGVDQQLKPLRHAAKQGPAKEVLGK